MEIRKFNCQKNISFKPFTTVKHNKNAIKHNKMLLKYGCVF